MFFDKEMQKKWETVRSSLESAILRDNINEFKKQKDVFLKLKQVWLNAHKERGHYVGMSNSELKKTLDGVVQNFFKVKVGFDNDFAPFTVLGLRVRSENYKIYLSELADVFGVYDKERLMSERARMINHENGSKKVSKDVELLSLVECAAMQGFEFGEKELFERTKYSWELMLKERLSLSAQQYYIDNVLFCLAVNRANEKVVNYVLEQGAHVNYIKVQQTKDGLKKLHVVEEALRTGGNTALINTITKSQDLNWSYTNLSNETLLEIMIKKVMNVSYSKDDPMIYCLKLSIERCKIFEKDSSYGNRLHSCLNYYSNKRSSSWYQSLSEELKHLISKSAAIGQAKVIETAIVNEKVGSDLQKRYNSL